MVERVQCVVAGAGVVGLSAARALALRGVEVLVCETETRVCAGVSSRSSEVIHAGLYYDATPVKRAMCVRGKELLYAYCADHAIPVDRCGKLVVATSGAQRPALDVLRAAAHRAGVPTAMLDPPAVAVLEPEVRCVAALHSPSTGVVDSHSLAVAYLADAEGRGATVALRTRVVEGESGRGGVDIVLEGIDGGERTHVRCDYFVNAAGLYATRVADSIRVGTGSSSWRSPRPRFAKGSYFSLRGARPFTRLVYPLPEPQFGGLGIHSTVDVAGRVKFGPDLEWLPDDVDLEDPALYHVDGARLRPHFAQRIASYYPNLDPDRLEPDYAGIRPKIVLDDENNDSPTDFLVAHPAPGLVHLLGIESPGLTSSLALADHVADLIFGRSRPPPSH